MVPWSSFIALLVSVLSSTRSTTNRAHIHITGSGQAKIDLIGPDGMPRVIASIGIGRGEMRRLLAEVIERRDAFFAGMGAYSWPT
jgi:hypothetical protein